MLKSLPTVTSNKKLKRKKAKLIATSHTNGNITLSNPEDGKIYSNFEKQNEEIISINFSNSNASNFLASAGTEETVKIWDLKTQKIIQQYKVNHPILNTFQKEHEDSINCLSFNATDTQIASGDDSGVLIICELKEKIFHKFIEFETQAMKSLQYSPHQQNLIGSVYDSGDVILWDLNSSKPFLKKKEIHSSPCSMIQFCPENALLFSTIGLDKKLIFHDLKSSTYSIFSY
jgi:WD40 repeat protein